MSTPRTQHRVQVNDLPEAERIQPGPIQSDTYARPAMPPINNDLERLAGALGGFSSALIGLGRRQEANAEAERKKAEAAQTSRADAEWAAWTASSTSGDQLAAYKAGTAPIDFVTERLYRKHWAGLQGDALAAEIEQDIVSGAIPFGTEGFNVDGYLIERARPHVDAMRGNDDLMVTFANKFDTIGDSLRKRNAEALGKVRTENLESIAASELDKAFKNGVYNGAEGEGFMGEMRKLYGAFGPRMEGGSLDIQRGRMDELVLDMLEGNASDPNLATDVLQFLHTDRRDLADGESRIGSLAQVKRHAAQIERIQKAAQKALAEEEKSLQTEALIQTNIAALAAENGTFNGIQDYTGHNYADPENPISITAEKQKEAAVVRYLEQLRAANGGVDPGAEIDALVRNNVKHPAFFEVMEGAVSAGLGSDMSPEQIGRVVQAATLYEMMPFDYAQDHLTKRSKDFFESYRYARHYMKMTPEQAAMSMGRIFMSPEGQVDPFLSGDIQTSIDTAAKSIGKGWFGGGVSNPMEMSPRIRQLATLYIKANGMDPKSAIEAAAERVKESAVVINGRAIAGVPGLLQGDEDNVNVIFDQIAKDHATALKVHGVNSGKELSLSSFRDGAFFVSRVDGWPVTDASGRPLLVSVAQIQQIRRQRQLDSEDRAIKSILDKREDSPPSEPRVNPWDGYRPHELIQKGLSKFGTADDREAAELDALNPALPKRKE